MNKTFKIYGVLFAVVMVLLILFKLNKPQTINWHKSYDPTEKSPFGTFVFDKELSGLMENKLTRTNRSPYQYFGNPKTFEPKNIVLFNYPSDTESDKKLLEQVKNGSDLMIILGAGLGFELDTLKIGELEELNYDSKNTLHFTNPQLKKDSLILDKLPNRKGYSYLEKHWEILGYTSSPEESSFLGANFIHRTYGKGNIYIHTEPLFLTNYYLLKPGNQNYAQDVFSYLPKRETLYFEESQEFQSSSLMRFILANPPLKYAWWLILGGLLLFVIFNAKRKQREVPIIEPLKNKSAEFVKSIGNLYLQEGDFHDMMSKKSQYFLHRVRMHYQIDTQHLDDDFAKKLQLKSEESEELIQEAISLIKKSTDPYASVTKEDLIRLNQVLDYILN